MSSSEIGATWPDDRLKAVGLAVGGFSPLIVAALLVPFRNDALGGTNAALVFVVVVVLAAACGGRSSGAVAAVVSTLSYDFFLTRPYQSLKIDRADDIVTAALLLGIGLLVAELVALGHRSQRGSERARANVARLHRVAELVATGGNTDAVLDEVNAELVGLLSLRACEFETPPFESVLPRIDRNGAIDSGRRRWLAREFTLPAEGVELAVLGAGHLFGRFVLTPDWDVGVSIEARAVAVVLADQLGSAFAAKPSTRPGAAGNAQ